MRGDHECFMRLALDEAARGGAEGNIAVASLVVRDGTVAGRGRNLEAITLDPTAHAETVAVRDASRALRRRDLAGHTVYTTFEPCPMCLGAIMASGISVLVMGARLQPGVSRWGAYAVERLLELVGWGDRLQVVTGTSPTSASACARSGTPATRRAPRRPIPVYP